MLLRIISILVLAAPLAYAEDGAKVPEPGPPPAAGILTTSPAVAVATGSPTSKTIELEWDVVDNARAYEVRLSPTAKGVKPLIFKSSEAKLAQEVPLGIYKLQIRSISVDDVYSVWSPATDFEVAIKETFPLFPENNAVIDSKNKEKQALEFKWTPVKNVAQYTLKVWSDDRKDHPWIFTGKSTTKLLAVPPGAVYYWDVFFASADGVAYDQNPRTFTFTLQGERLMKPEIAKKQSSTALVWKPSPDAETYKAKLYYRHLDEKKWEPVAEDTLSECEWHMEKLKPGAYKLELAAGAPGRQSSEVASQEFLIKPTADELALVMRLAVHSEESGSKPRRGRH